MENKHLVALILDNEDKCVEIAQVCNLGDKAYKQRVNEKRAYEEKCAKEKLEHKEEHKGICKELQHLDKNEVYLAKALYDNFVDRGFLNDNEDFQKHFFEHIYKGAKLDIKKAPTDFLTILGKVANYNEEK